MMIFYKILSVPLVLILMNSSILRFSFVHETYNCETSMFNCGNTRCIPLQWICDNEDDCHDNSDELDCDHICDTKMEFRCKTNETECMPVSWRCDGQSDCRDNSDEQDCIGTVQAKQLCKDNEFSCNGDGYGPCIDNIHVCDGESNCINNLDEDNITCLLHKCNNETEFKCVSDGRCVSKRWLCDGDHDCQDKTDEKDCVQENCKANEFKCDIVSGTHRCIESHYKCDGTIDCRDKTDESNMTCGEAVVSHGDCRFDDFRCKSSGECFSKAWKCDNDIDCEDGSDEDECSVCSDTMHKKCDSGLCILSELWCDGINHCSDNSDENDCNQECDMLTEFDCGTAEKHKCINVSRTCDSHADCDDNRDENEDLCRIDHSKACEENNGFCEQVCHATRIQVFCGCHPGYELTSNNKSCSDIDECKLGGHCSQSCRNTVGSFKCACGLEYTLDPRDHTTCLLKGAEPVMLFSNRHDLRQIGLYSGHYYSIVENMRNIIAIDYDVNQRFLYLSDITSENITRFKLNGEYRAEEKSMEVLAKDDIGIPDGLAYDWVHDNVYWTDTGKDRIEVMSLKNSGEDGYLMNQCRQTLIDTELDEPRAIVVDPRKKHRYVFWTDWGKKPKIERAFLDGSNRTEIVNTGVRWPNGLAIDYKGNRLYWVDAKMHVIESADFNGLNRLIILDSEYYLAHPFAISIFENEIFWSDWVSHSIWKMSRQRHPHSSISTFIQDLTSPMDLHIYHKLMQSDEPNVCLKSGCTHICLPHAHEHATDAYTCKCPRDTQIIKYKMSPDLHSCQAIKNEIGVDSHVTQPIVEKGERFSVPIIIALSCILFIIIAILLLLVLHRMYRKRNIKTFNFDNPVYLRTTSETHVSLKSSQQQPIAPIHSVMQPLTQSPDIV